jgi:glycosyltransferase involved in cell wall biosynthesis
MACGTPVVGANVGGLKYLLDDGHGISVEPKNAESLCKGIQMVLESSTKRADLIEKGLERAKENDQKVMTQRVIELYQIRQRA